MTKRSQDDNGDESDDIEHQKQMCREDCNQLSMESNTLSSTCDDTSSDDNNNILEMMAAEKAAAMDPIKSRSMSISIFNRDTAAATDIEEQQQDPDTDPPTTPGAYRVVSGRVQGRLGGDSTVDTTTVQSDDRSDDTSCVIVIPRAAVVEDDKEEKQRGNDMESQIREIPLVVAEKQHNQATGGTPLSSEHLSSEAAGRAKRKSKILKISLLVCLTLVAVLLGGVLYVLLEDGGRKNQSNALQDGRQEPPPPKHGGKHKDGRKSHKG